MKLLSGHLRQKAAQRREALYRALLHHEARLGGELFGPVPKDRRREFFCLDEHTWVWHEEWTDAASGKRNIMTTRYDVRPNGVLKSQGGTSYQRLSLEEARHLQQAIRLYEQRMTTELTKMMQPA